MTTIEQPARATPNRRMTESEFEAWALASDARAEWVEGEIIDMSPISTDHWDITRWLSTLMNLHAEKNNLGIVGGPELMIRFPNRRRVADIMFISNQRLPNLRKNYLEGPPDLIIEIVSPDSLARDWRDKYLDYQANAVPEYWVIDPNASHAEFYHLQNNQYVRLEETDGTLRSPTLTGFHVRPEWLWQRPLPNVYQTAKLLGII